MEEKYWLAAKAGFFCGLAPALVYVIYLYYLPGGGDEWLGMVAGLVYILAPVAAGVLSAREAFPLLHKVRDAMIVAGVGGAVQGIVQCLALAVMVPVLQWAARSFSQNPQYWDNFNFSFGGSAGGAVIVIILAASVMAVIAAVSGLFYAMTKVPIKLENKSKVQ